ncbi:hypothetical protein SPHS6_03842 [Sphingobium sp. S6]|nr:hypothetical protein SPHS6_03842 [Sphingobium sp. S6]CAD7342071.1 hypothetical protein SPHS8_03853 [Sphingobium sp. S8]
MATFQPSPSAPMRSMASASAPSKNTSANSASPVIWRIGRASTPGWSMGTMRNERPLLPTLPGSVRATTKHQSAIVPIEVQIFWPSMMYLSPSRRALVFTLARSEPAPGSE